MQKQAGKYLPSIKELILTSPRIKKLIQEATLKSRHAHAKKVHREYLIRKAHKLVQDAQRSMGNASGYPEGVIAPLVHDWRLSSMENAMQPGLLTRMGNKITDSINEANAGLNQELNKALRAQIRQQEARKDLGRAALNVGLGGLGVAGLGGIGALAYNKEASVKEKSMLTEKLANDIALVAMEKLQTKTAGVGRMLKNIRNSAIEAFDSPVVLTAALAGLLAHPYVSRYRENAENDAYKQEVNRLRPGVLEGISALGDAIHRKKIYEIGANSHMDKHPRHIKITPEYLDNHIYEINKQGGPHLNEAVHQYLRAKYIDAMATKNSDDDQLFSISKFFGRDKAEGDKYVNGKIGK